MLRTFDDSLITTAVQQLTTDLDSMAARIKKLEEGGGGGRELILTKKYEHVNITDPSTVLFDTISMPDTFVFSAQTMLLVEILYENNEAAPKVCYNTGSCVNLTGALTGNASPMSQHTLYLNSSNIPTTAAVGRGVFPSSYNIGDKELKINSRYDATYGYTGGTITVNVYTVPLDTPSI